jgi:hypothetical protein
VPAVGTSAFGEQVSFEPIDFVLQTLPLTLFFALVVWGGVSGTFRQAMTPISPYKIVGLLIVLVFALGLCEGVSSALTGAPIPEYSVDEETAYNRALRECGNSGPACQAAAVGAVLVARVGDYFTYYGDIAFTLSVIVGCVLGWVYGTYGVEGLVAVAKAWMPD